MTLHPLPWLWPDNLSAERWLIIGDDVFGLATLAAARFANVQHVADFDDYAGEPADVVACQQLFNGVRHPLLRLEQVCALTRRYALLHAQPLPANPRAILRWDESNAGWHPNRTALARLARSAGFARVESLADKPDWLWLKAMRRWPEQPVAIAATLAIRNVFNPVTHQQHFPRTGRSAFLAIVVAGLPALARRWEIRVNVGEFGVQPIYVGPAEQAGCMQVNVPVPPGLPAGTVEICLWHRDARADSFMIELGEGTRW